MIKKNVGGADQKIRIVAGLIALFAGYFLLTGLLQIIAYIIGIVAIATGYLRFCGLYKVLGISTDKEKSK